MTRFVILAAPRSGSNLLCTLLQSHPRVLCHHELFNPRGIFLALPLRDGVLDFGDLARRDADPLAFLREVWRRDLGHACVGFKFTRGQNEAVLRHVVGDRGLHKIVLRRRNRVKTLASELIAEARDHWEDYVGDPPAPRGARVRIDPQSLDAHARLNADFYAAIEGRLRSDGQPWMAIDYEDLFAAEAQQGLLAFLDLPPADVADGLRAASRKQNSHDLRDLIANFEELDHSLQGTEFHAELHDLEA